MEKGSAGCYSCLISGDELGCNCPDSRFRGNGGQVSKFDFLAKVGAPRGRGVSESDPQPEIKYELKPADPFSLHGRRLG